MTGPHIMIVDDEVEMRQLLSSTIRGLGISSIKEVSNAKEALFEYRIQPADILFLDLNMPEMDGFEMLVKLHEKFPSAYVVIVSGEGGIDNVQQAIQLGVQGFIIKPYKLAKVKEAIDKYMKKTPAIKVRLIEPVFSR